MTTITASSIWADVSAIRDSAPLVHNITNYVVMNTTANALLALGASPVMAHAPDEVADMVAIAGALVINIGTLSSDWIASMEKAASTANALGKPLVLDPVGAGATDLRTRTSRHLMETYSPSVIRGNGSEIMALLAEDVTTKGVDSSSESDAALGAAGVLAGKTGGVVCITGRIDYIVSSKGRTAIANGHPMMPRVTGLGCTASALCGAFAAVNPDTHTAIAHAMAVMGIAGEMAAESAKGPGSLQMAFIDALYTLSENDVVRLFKPGDAAS